MARVLVVGYSVVGPDVRGPDRHGVQTLHVVKALASRFAVDVLTLRVGELAYVERFQKTRMLRVPVGDGPVAERLSSFRRAVRRQLEGSEYDVVHFRDAWSGVPVLERRASLGYRTVFEVARSVHGDASADPGLAADLAAEEAHCLAQADLVLAGSEAARRFLVRDLPAERAARVVIVPPGVDIDRFDGEADEGGDRPVVLYSGALASGHGVRVLLRAFRDVVDRVPARLVLAGPVARDFAQPLATALAQLELGPHVDLPGPVANEDMPRLISRASVCVVPAAPDLAERPLAGLPSKLLEVLACKRAVVAARRSSVREICQDGVEGLLFDPASPRDLADKLLRLLGDESLRARLAEAGQRKVRQRFTASGMRRRLLEAYAPLLPPSTWNPVGAGSAARDWLDDTRPYDSGATLVTGMPHDDTAPALDLVAAAASSSTPYGVEPWLVVAGIGAANEGGDGSGETAAVTAAAAPLPSFDLPPGGGRFVAGEIGGADGASDPFAADAATLAGVTAPAAAAVPGLPDFVAAGELLGAVKPARADTES